jgi:hypothetical protein
MPWGGSLLVSQTGIEHCQLDAGYALDRYSSVSIFGINKGMLMVHGFNGVKYNSSEA